MNPSSISTLLISLCLLLRVQYQAAAQSETGAETYAFARKNRSNKIIAAPMPETKADVSAPSKVRNQVFQFDAEKKILVLNKTLPDFACHSLVYIQDATGRNIRNITINPNEAPGMIVPLSDLLAGSYHVVLIPDFGQKIQGAFEIDE